MPVGCQNGAAKSRDAVGCNTRVLQLTFPAWLVN